MCIALTPHTPHTATPTPPRFVPPLNDHAPTQAPAWRCRTIRHAAQCAALIAPYALSRAGLTASQTVAKIAAHAAVGGTMSVLQGGKFGHGFATAGLNESLSGRIGRIGNPGGRIAASALLGGTTSQLVGGKFANGAVTAAFATAFNEGAHAISRAARLQRARRALGDLQSTLEGKVFKSEQLAAEAFCFSGGCKITERYGIEVGANIDYFNNPNDGFVLTDFTLGNEGQNGVPSSIGLPAADVHTHPIGAGDGLSGVAYGRDGKTFGYAEDLGVNVDRQIDGFVFRAGDRAGFRFDFDAFDKAVGAAAPGQVIDARTFVTRLPPAVGYRSERIR